MPLVAEVHKAVVAPPAIGEDDEFGFDTLSNRSQKTLLRTVGNYLGLHFAVPFEDVGDDRLAAGPPATLAAHARGAEVGLVDLDLSGSYRSPLFALHGQELVEAKVNVVDRPYRDAR